MSSLGQTIKLFISADTAEINNCRIHHVTASMTTIDLIIKPRTELLEAVTTLFKLAAPSISSCALSIYFSQFLPLLTV